MSRLKDLRSMSSSLKSRYAVMAACSEGIKCVISVGGL